MARAKGRDFQPLSGAVANRHQIDKLMSNSLRNKQRLQPSTRSMHSGKASNMSRSIQSPTPTQMSTLSVLCPRMLLPEQAKMVPIIVPRQEDIIMIEAITRMATSVETFADEPLDTMLVEE